MNAFRPTSVFKLSLAVVTWIAHSERCSTRQLLLQTLSMWSVLTRDVRKNRAISGARIGSKNVRKMLIANDV